MFRTPKTPLLIALLIALSLILSAPALAAQSSAAVSDIAPRVVSPIDESNRVILHGNVHPLAQARFDKGAVDDAFPAERLCRHADGDLALRRAIHFENQ
jgi:hypothetical protein